MLVPRHCSRLSPNVAPALDEVAPDFEWLGFPGRHSYLKSHVLRKLAVCAMHGHRKGKKQLSCSANNIQALSLDLGQTSMKLQNLKVHQCFYKT